MKRIEDCENVVGGDLEDPIGEEGKTPRDTQHATQSQDGDNTSAISVHFRSATFAPLETNEPGDYDDEGREGEEEDQRIVAHVDNVVDGVVCYPAPWNRGTGQRWKSNMALSGGFIYITKGVRNNSHGHIVCSVVSGNNLFTIFSYAEEDNPNYAGYY